MSAQLKPLSEQIEQAVREDAATKVQAAIVTAHVAAIAAYQGAMTEVCGYEFRFAADAILHEAEIKIAEAAQRCAERKALAAVVDRLVTEAGGE